MSSMYAPTPNYMPTFAPNYHQYNYPAQQSATILAPSRCTLIVRQEPLEALITPKGKEKSRKPIDPPPVVQLLINGQDDAAANFLQNPYLFMSVSLFKTDKEEAVAAHDGQLLLGTLVSSLHRLKDLDNKEGGFFIFGDISVVPQGSFRLHFALFEFDKEKERMTHLCDQMSQEFNVLAQKDFKGMGESSYLSRSFSDQGVRLRLRKEARGVMAGSKRAYPFSDTTINTPIQPSRSSEYSSGYEDADSPIKKYKMEHEARRDSYSTGHMLPASTFSQPTLGHQQQPLPLLQHHSQTQPSLPTPQFSLGSNIGSNLGSNLGSSMGYGLNTSMGSSINAYAYSNNYHNEHIYGDYTQ